MLATCHNEMTTRYNWDFMGEKNSCETGREKGTETDCLFRMQCDSGSSRQWDSNSWAVLWQQGGRVSEEEADVFRYLDQRCTAHA